MSLENEPGTDLERLRSTGQAFRDALDAHLAASREAGEVTDPYAANAEDLFSRTHAALMEAATVHANLSGHVDPVPVPGEPGSFTPAPLVAEYERLRDDPAADRAAVNVAAEALAVARQAHRVRAGLPLTSGAG